MRKPNVWIIIQSTALLVLAVAFWAFFIMGLVAEFSTAESPVYGEYTFEKYKKVKHERENNVTEENYYIYVEEYPLFLVIGDNVFDKTNEAELVGLKPGDKILISTYHYADFNNIQAMSHNGDDILLYEDFLSDKVAKDRRHTIIAVVFAGIMTTALVVGIVSYNRTGKAIFFENRYHNPYPNRS